MRRINQHGGRTGAKVNKGKRIEEVIEIQHLGKMARLQAENIENNIALQYRRKFGARKVRGGYDIYTQTSIIPTYTPGSLESFLFIIGCLLLAVIILLCMARFYN